MAHGGSYLDKEDQMKFAVTLDDGTEELAIIKTEHYDRAYAVFQLCELHLPDVFPHATITVKMCGDRRMNQKVGMHPDKDDIIEKLRAKEFPLPASKNVLEGVDYSVERSVV